MLNGLGEFQRIVVLGGKSDLAHAVLGQIPISEDAEIFLCARDFTHYSLPKFLSSHRVQWVEVDFMSVDNALDAINVIFEGGDVDLVLFAYAILGNEDLQLSSQVFNEVLHTNLVSQVIILNEINSKLLEQMHGHVLIFSSVAGIRPRRRNFVYGLTKFGVDFLAQGLQKVTCKKNVYITILRPGFVFTKMTADLHPAPFATDVDKVGKIAAKAILKRKRIVYAPRALFLLMGILRILPEHLFRKIDN